MKRRDVHAWLLGQNFAEDEQEDEQEREGRSGDGRRRATSMYDASAVRPGLGEPNTRRGQGERGLP